jgi:hypothetical protein
VRRGLVTAAAVLLATWAAPAAADGPAAAGEPAVGFLLGARVSAAFPMGSLLSDPATGSMLIDELVAISLPVQLDVGLTIHRRWFVGAYVQYAWSFLQLGGCSVGESCSVTGLHAGLQATYAFREGGGPWAGVGTGLEWLFTSYTGGGSTTRIDVSGWEFAIFQVGWDVEVSPGWKVGPWFSGSIGEFNRASLSTDGRDVANGIANRALHGWLQFGVKGSFGP